MAHVSLPMCYAIKHYFYVTTDITVSFWCQEAFMYNFLNKFRIIKNLDTQFICVAKNLLKRLCEYSPRRLCPLHFLLTYYAEITEINKKGSFLSIIIITVCEEIIYETFYNNLPMVSQSETR